MLAFDEETRRQLVGMVKKSSNPDASAVLRKVGIARLAEILQDERMDEVVRMGHELLKSGMNAGSGYSEVWIRDLNTFIELSCQEYDKAVIRENLLMFFRENYNALHLIHAIKPGVKILAANHPFERSQIDAQTKQQNRKRTRLQGQRIGSLPCQTQSPAQNSTRKQTKRQCKHLTAQSCQDSRPKSHSLPWFFEHHAMHIREPGHKWQTR